MKNPLNVDYHCQIDIEVHCLFLSFLIFFLILLSILPFFRYWPSCDCTISFCKNRNLSSKILFCIIEKIIQRLNHYSLLWWRNHCQRGIYLKNPAFCTTINGFINMFRKFADCQPILSPFSSILITFMPREHSTCRYDCAFSTDAKWYA